MRSPVRTVPTTLTGTMPMMHTMSVLPLGLNIKVDWFEEGDWRTE